MIAANDLRIGNLLYESSFSENPEIDFDIITVAAINDIDKIIRDTNDNIYSYDYLYSIPLTPEILVKASFEPTMNEYDMHCFSLTIAGRFTIQLVRQPYIGGSYGWRTFIETNVGMGFDSMDLNPPQYLHHLQNFCYINTGEEIEIK